MLVGDSARGQLSAQVTARITNPGAQINALITNPSYAGELGMVSTVGCAASHCAAGLSPTSPRSVTKGLSGMC